MLPTKLSSCHRHTGDDVSRDVNRDSWAEPTDGFANVTGLTATNLIDSNVLRLIRLGREGILLLLLLFIAVHNEDEHTTCDPHTAD